MAMAVMMSRQNGLSLADALINTDRMANEKKATENEVFILRGMLRDAYDEPKFSSESYKQDKIDEFSSKYYLACRERYGFYGCKRVTNILYKPLFSGFFTFEGMIWLQN